MGWETANIHLGAGKAGAIQRWLARGDASWLRDAAQKMAQAVHEDWRLWRRPAR